MNLKLVRECVGTTPWWRFAEEVRPTSTALSAFVSDLLRLDRVGSFLCVASTVAALAFTVTRTYFELFVGWLFDGVLWDSVISKIVCTNVPLGPCDDPAGASAAPARRGC
jgi:hypothetical protein